MARSPKRPGSATLQQCLHATSNQGELTMSTRLDPDLLADAMVDTDDADAPIDEWTLDELERSADLSSVRSAWTRADEQSE
jgi:hypothetical protein